MAIKMPLSLDHVCKGQAVNAERVWAAVREVADQSGECRPIWHSERKVTLTGYLSAMAPATN